MPIYEYHCKECGESQDAFNKVDARESNAPVCCGVQTTKAITACMVFIPGECHYVCPVTDQKVTSYRQRANIMAEHGLRDANDMKPEQVIAAKKKRTAENKALADQMTKVEGMTNAQVMEAVA